MRSYDYSHRQGVERISWTRFEQLSRQLAEQVAPEKVDGIVGVARAGLFPATFLACALRRELCPVRITRRVNDRITFEKPVWRVDVPETVRGQRVLVVDEITDTGQSLSLVMERVKERGASYVVGATLVSHSWARPLPKHVALLTDALVVFPWDRQVYEDGRWKAHPELVEALAAQGSTDET